MIIGLQGLQTALMLLVTWRGHGKRIIPSIVMKILIWTALVIIPILSFLRHPPWNWRTDDETIEGRAYLYDAVYGVHFGLNIAHVYFGITLLKY